MPSKHMNQTLDNNLKDAFLKAYEDWNDAIFRYCFNQTSNREVALDLASETFTKTWEYLVRGNTVEQWKPFLYRSATNAIIDYRRKKKAVSLDSMMEEGYDHVGEAAPMGDHEQTFDAEKAMKVVGELPEKYRDVLMLRYVDDLSISEIAEVTGETENNVSVRIHRGLEKIEEILKPKE